MTDTPSPDIDPVALEAAARAISPSAFVVDPPRQKDSSTKEAQRSTARDKAQDAITAYLSALPKAAKAEGVLIRLLDDYDAETAKVPLGHEDVSRGRSTYNWRRAIVAELRNALAADDNDYDPRPGTPEDEP